jgi:hypothetical protein
MCSGFLYFCKFILVSDTYKSLLISAFLFKIASTGETIFLVGAVRMIFSTEIVLRIFKY